MNPHALQWQEGWWLDPSGAAYLEPEGTLLLADLHLGYAWAERVRGNLMPILDRDETAERALQVIQAYRPRRVILAGDVVHGTLPLKQVEEAVHGFLDQITGQAELVILRGNHDRPLERLLKRSLPAFYELPGCVVAHGDRPVECGDRIALVGHEHPAILLSDDPVTAVRCPCFLVDDRAVVLPAFSRWAAGTVYRGRPLQSPLLCGIRFRTAYALAGPRLLPVVLDSYAPRREAI